MKIYPITFATHFMKGHPREAEPTGFVDKIRAGTKIHTIRSNFGYWNKRIQSIRNGEGYLSLRTWAGKPYRSQQEEFMRLYDTDAGIQKIRIDRYSGIYVDNDMPIRHIVAKHDGLPHNDFHAWFQDKVPFEGAVIHFTNFRY